MPLFGKGKVVKYDYYLLLHSLSPFPANYKSIYIVWQRGSGKRGQTRAVGPAAEGPSRSWATFQFDEPFHVSCTLNQDPKAQGGAGGYEKKWLILTILDGDGSGKAKEPLGRVVVNLADYAADDDKATMSFTVAASKAISSGVGECKMLITLGCRSKGKPPMHLGGRAINRMGSVASSENTDDEEDEDALRHEASFSQPVGRQQPAVRPTAKTVAVPVKTKRAADPYVKDDFLEDEDFNRQQEGGAAWMSVPAGKPAPKAEAPREATSDQDSEDEFLAQAVAAMEGKAPMPVAPAVTRQTSRGSAIRSGTAEVTMVPSIGATIPPVARPVQSVAAQSKAPPITPFTDNSPLPDDLKPTLPPPATAFTDDGPPGNSVRPKGPLFALKPEGQAEQGSAPPAVTSKASAESQPPPFMTRPSKFDAEPLPSRGSAGASNRDVRGVADVQKRAATDMSDGPQKVSNLVSQFETNEPPLLPRQVSSRQTSKKESSLQGASSSGRGFDERPITTLQSEGSKGSPRRPLREACAEDEEGSQGLAQDRIERGTSRSRLAAEGLESSSSGSASPRRRKLEAARQEQDRARSVVLPTGTVSIRKRPVVSAPEDNTLFSESPVKASAPGRHWLDEPEDLGVEPSPMSSPAITPRPAYQAVAPAPIAKVRDAGITPSGSRTALEDPFGDSASTASLPPTDDLGDPSTNPFLFSHPVAQASGGDIPSKRSTASLKEREAATPPAPTTIPAAAPDSASSTARFDPVLAEPPKAEASQSNGNVHSGGQLSSAQANGGDSAALETYTRELRAVAALEASVYLAQSGKSRGIRASSKARNVHAPARRLARTTISLGPEEGIIFGLRAIRAIEAAADGAGDIAGRAYWWSNCIQLRWMLWAMCNGGGSAGEGEADLDPDEFDWVMQVLVPPLRELEAHIFQQLFQHMWSFILIEGVTADQLPGAQAKHWIIPPSKEEEAVQRWIDGFQTVHRSLLPAAKLVTAGHVTLLKHKTLTALMQRLDAALFERLARGEDSRGTMRRDVFSSSWRTRKGLTGVGLEAELPLDERTLPFSPGENLTFGVGVNLKMAATRWTNWAADIGLRNDKGSPEEGYLLFPKLRATADLLMMPKEVLTDRAIRSEVVPGLPLRVICDLLSRFQADDLARDPLPPGLLEALMNETPPVEESPSPISRGLADYDPPSEAALLADGLIEPVSLEMDDESEDELESLVEMYDPDKQGHTTERFHLLRELWASAR